MIGKGGMPQLYEAQKQKVASGMYSGMQSPQMSPEYLRDLSTMGMSGAPNFGTPYGPQGLLPGSGMEPRFGGFGGGAGFGGDISGESGFRQLGPIGGNGSPNWMPSWLRSPQPGTPGGLNLAENGQLIGQGLGLAFGLPGLGSLGNAFGNQYINNHTFQSTGGPGTWWAGQGPDPGPVGGPLDAFNQSVNDNDPRTWGALASGAPRPGGSFMSQAGNRQAGMNTDFRTQWNWAHAPRNDVGSDFRLWAGPGG